MTFDTSFIFTINDLFFLVTTIVSICGVWFTFKNKVTNLEKKIDDMSNVTTEAKEEILAMKLDIAKNYTTNEAVRNLEQRLSTGISDLTKSINSLKDYLMNKRD